MIQDGYLYTERCEFIECNNSMGKKNQCYGQSSETFQGKYYCDEHMEKVKADYEYEHATKCEMKKPSYIAPYDVLFVDMNGHEIKQKYKRILNKFDNCTKVAQNIYENKNYCDECLEIAMELVPRCRFRNCTGFANDGELYCSDCMYDTPIEPHDVDAEE